MFKSSGNDFETLIDDYSRMWFGYLLIAKSNYPDALKTFIIDLKMITKYLEDQISNPLLYANFKIYLQKPLFILCVCFTFPSNY